MKKLGVGRLKDTAIKAREAVNRHGGDHAVRWIKAIDKAEQALSDHPDRFSWNGERLLIWSDSGKFYEANGTCQCPAHGRGIPCWHMAAARLVKRYFEPFVIDDTRSYIKPNLGRFPLGIGRYSI